MNDFSKNIDLPKGISQIWDLPNAKLGALWDSIIVDEKLKSQLLSQAILNNHRLKPEGLDYGLKVRIRVA